MVPPSIARIERPDSALLHLYLLRSALPYALLLAGAPFTFGVTLLPIALTFLPAYIRYHTLRYRFDESGVAVSWGYLFRSETYLTYEKIQDIHLSRGLFERWLGIGTVSIQTASGASMAEESIVGVRAFEEVRDYLYGRMRVGLRPAAASAPPRPEGTAAAVSASAGEGDPRLLAILGEIRAEVVELRKTLEAASGRGPGA